MQNRPFVHKNNPVSMSHYVTVSVTTPCGLTLKPGNSSGSISALVLPCHRASFSDVLDMQPRQCCLRHIDFMNQCYNISCMLQEET